MTTTHGTDQAWAFVLDNHDRIKRFCRRFGGRMDSLDYEEFCSDVILRIVDRHHSLDLSGARYASRVISTWIGWQVRAVVTTYCRRFKKRCREQSNLGAVDDVAVDILCLLPAPEGEWGSAESVAAQVADEDTHAALELLYAEAGTTERQAIRCYLLDLTDEEGRERYGMGPAERDQALRTLGRRHDGEAAAVL